MTSRAHVRYLPDIRVTRSHGAIAWDTEPGRARLFISIISADAHRAAAPIDFLADTGRLCLILSGTAGRAAANPKAAVASFLAFVDQQLASLEYNNPSTSPRTRAILRPVSVSLTAAVRRRWTSTSMS